MKRIAVLMIASLALVPLFSAPASASGEGRVVLIGIPSLRWTDVQAGRAPHLRRLAGRSAVGLLSAKTIGHSTCPLDGWATVSSGTRAATGLCDGALTVEPDASGAVVKDVPSIGAYVDSLGFPSRIGLLGDAVHSAGGCVSAAGPGAALGGADGAGRVDRYAADPAAANVTDCPVTLIGFDDLLKSRGERRRDVTRQVDATVGDLLARIPAGTTVLVADHLRPAADQTHIGRFISALLQGDAAPILERKLTVMTRSFTDLRFAPLTLAAVLVLILLLRGPAKDLLGRAPLLRAGMLGALTTLVVGTLVNDSGVSIPALGLTVLVPLLLAATARTLTGPAALPPAPVPDPAPPGVGAT